MVKGKNGEQFIAQHLRFLDPKDINAELFYWLRGKKKGAAEVDFVISKDSKIYPIEVKSGATGKMRSLWQFLAEKNISDGIKMDLKYRANLAKNITHSLRIDGRLKKIKCDLFEMISPF